MPTRRTAPGAPGGRTHGTMGEAPLHRVGRRVPPLPPGIEPPQVVTARALIQLPPELGRRLVGDTLALPKPLQPTPADRTLGRLGTPGYLHVVCLNVRTTQFVHHVTHDAGPPVLHRFTADRGDHHHRVDLVVLRRLPADARVSRTVIQRAVAAGHVTIAGRIAPRASARVLEGQAVDAWLPAPPARLRPQPETAELAVCYEDDHLLIVDKPPGMVVHPTYKHAGGTMLNALLGRSATAAAGWTPSLVHRLDKDTSGLVLVAKQRDVLLALQRQWSERAVVKRYAAITLGRPPRRAGSITLKLRRDPLDRRRMVASPTLGQDSVTRYDIVATSRGSRRGIAVVACELGTGRLHQIRVHLSAIGAPIVGDAVYGPARFSGLTDARLVAALKGLRRQALHACQLVFEHPVTHARIDASAPLPADMSALLLAAGIDTPPLGRSLD